MRPILFRVPWVNLPIYSYGVMLGISFIVGWYIALTLAERDGLPRERMASCYVVTGISAVVGARLLYILTNLHEFRGFLDLFKIWQGGIVAYGGFLGGLIASTLYCWRHKISLLAWADCAVPSLATGLFFTRIGCFLFGCDYGKRTTSVLGLQFPGPSAMAPSGSPAYADHLHTLQRAADQGMAGAPEALRQLVASGHSLPVHPTQLYESGFGLLLFGLLMLVRRYRQFTGQVFLTFFLTYGAGRYLLEMVRDDKQRGSVGPLTTSQFIALLTGALGVGLWVFLYRRYRANPAAARLWERAAAALPAPAMAHSGGGRGGSSAGKKKRR